MQPTALRLDENARLVIDWDDGESRLYRPVELRDQCPCATCREKRKQPPAELPILAPGEAAPLQIVTMQPMGAYAYAIQFSDGHNTGIFTFDLLKQLGEPLP